MVGNFLFFGLLLAETLVSPAQRASFEDYFAFSDPATCQPAPEHRALLEGLGVNLGEGQFRSGDVNVRDRWGDRFGNLRIVAIGEEDMAFEVDVEVEIFDLPLREISITHFEGGDPPDYGWRFDADIEEVRRRLAEAGFPVTSDANVISDEVYASYLWLAPDPHLDGQTIMSCGVR